MTEATPPTPASTRSEAERLGRELATICVAEAQAGAEVKRRAGDLRVRAALLGLDLDGDWGVALAAIEGADHPLTWALQLGAALARGDEALWQACVADARRRADRDDLADLAALALFRREAALALELARLAGDDAGLTARVAERVAGAWEAIVSGAERGGGGGEAEVEALVQAADVAQDRLGDLARAGELVTRARDRAARLTAPALSAYILERAIELAELRDDHAARALGCRARLTALGTQSDPAVVLERTLTRVALADALERSGASAEAAAELEALGDLPVNPALGAALVTRQRLRLERRRGDAAKTVAVLERLAAMSAQPWSQASTRRAAALASAKAPELAGALLRRLGSDAWSARELTALALADGQLATAAEVLTQLGRALGHGGLPALGLAARAFEMAGAGDTDVQITRWRDALGDERGRPDRNALEGRLRAERRAGRRQQTIETYRRLGAVLDGRRGAAYLAVGAVLAFDEGELALAEAMCKEAAERDADDLVVHALRAHLFRRAGRDNELAHALGALVNAVRSPTSKAAIYRQLAAVQEKVNDRGAAQQSYERALELSPDDVSTLLAFARLCEDAERWPRAVELRERAVALSSGAAAAEILCAIGELQRARLDDDAASVRAFERAVAADAGARPALAALTALFAKQRRWPEQIAVVRRRLPLAADAEEKLQLQLQLAQAAEQPELNDVGVALGAYRDALRLDAAHAGALAGLERLCQRENRLEVLVEALQRAPASPRTLRLLGEALERLERWPEVAEVREKELTQVEGAREVVRVARQLAEIYETRLNDLDAAARAWHRVDEADATDAQAAQALQRIYEARGRFADLAAAIERELAIAAGGDPHRPLELWLRLGEIRKSRLARADAAAEAFEKALELDARNYIALSALAEIYSAQKRDQDLGRVLDMRAHAASEPAERAAVMLQKAELFERAANIEAAQSAYAEAFRADPGNRGVFTALERVCYRREDWPAAMSLYAAAIELVEVQRSRAYRLADLYARRGQLQLAYLNDPDEAAASYRRVLELDAESDTAQTSLERIFAARADWPALIGTYERRAELVKDDAKRVEILRRAARVAAAKLRDPAEAARLYERLHAVDPTDNEALDALERQSERARDWQRLIGILTTRLSLTAGGDEAVALYLKIAQLYEENLSDIARAIESYRKILEIAPSHKEAIEALARLFEGTERWPELVEMTRRQIRIVTDRAQKALLYFKCGSVTESKFGKEEDAIRYYDAAIKTSPSCLPAVHGLRDLYLRREDWPRVIQTLELEAKLWTEDKERAGVFAHIGQIYGDKLKQPERAIEYYESAITVDKECLPANRALFELYFERGEFERAVPLAAILTQKVTREGDPVERSEFYRKRAIVAARTGDAAAAAESLVVALEIRPENVGALDLLVDECRANPAAYDFEATFRELDKLFRKRDAARELSRVLVGQSILREHALDIEGAEQLCLEALKRAPEERFVVEALVGLHERLRRFQAGAVVLEAFISRVVGPARQADRSWARYRLAQLQDEGAMDARAAALTLEELVAEDAGHLPAHFRLAQSLYLLARFDEARRACERLIQLAAAPEHTAPPEELARYYDYLGRIAEASEDVAGAGRAFRRAMELDPAYAPSALALARRVYTGVAHGAARQRDSVADVAQCEALLRAALEAAEARGWEAELPLRRGIARFWAAAGDTARAVAEYRLLLSRTPESHDDRVALAELLLANPATLSDAREELMLVLSDDLRHLPAYRLLFTIYQRTGDQERANRVAGVLQFLGFSDPSDRLPAFRPSPRRGALSEELRRTRLAPPAAVGLLTEAFLAVRESVEANYPAVVPPTAVPASALNDPALKVCIVDLLRLFGLQAEVYIARQVAGGVLPIEGARPAIYIAAEAVDMPDSERRFYFGRALEPLRGSWSLLGRLHPAERAGVGDTMRQLCLPEPGSAGAAAAQELVRALPRKAQKALERVTAAAGLSAAAGDNGRGNLPSGADWLAALEVEADRAGLLACDDLTAAVRVMAAMLGVDIGTNLGDGLEAPGVLTLRLLPRAAGLVHFFLSDAYHELRVSLSGATGSLASAPNLPVLS